jgi:glutamate dehydrogenase/leucine dehydrogenase
MKNKYKAETFSVNSELSFTVVYDEDANNLPANGGLRFYQYPDLKSQEEEAFTLAKHMTQKHSIYNTGFSGVKLVANGKVTENNKKQLLKKVGEVLNQFKGSIYTGCDLNMNNDDMLYLREITPYILNAIDAPQINTSTATAFGVYGALKAVMDKVNKNEKAKYLVHGIGKIGLVIAKELIKSGQNVLTYDINKNNAEIAGATNISDKNDWHEIQCDYLILCSASGLITEENVYKLNCKWIVSSSNSPFAGNKVVELLKRKGISWIPDVVSNAGAVICDSIEFNEPERYKNIDAELMYQCVQKHIYNKTIQLLDLAKQYRLTPMEALDIFLTMVKRDPVLLNEA